MRKRILSLMLTIVMLICMIPFTSLPASAATYYANGKAFPNSSFTANGTNSSNPYCQCGIAVGTKSHWCCWNYMAAAYRYIWGSSFSRSNSNNLLKDISASNRLLNAANLKKYLSATTPGASIRFDDDSAALNADNEGHSLIFLGLNSNSTGCYMLDANNDYTGRAYIKEYTWSSLASYFSFATYIKYIMWPNGSSYAYRIDNPTYTISYNANGGSGAPSAQTKTHGVTLTLSSTKPTRSGYTFLGWSTSSTATTATYSSGGSYTANASATLYAVWSANKYTISYNANGGSKAPSAQTKTHGVTLTLSSTKPTRSGYTFLGWSTSSTATTATYSSGGSYTANASTTLYAVWQPKTLKIYYSANGGSILYSSFYINDEDEIVDEYFGKAYTSYNYGDPLQLDIDSTFDLTNPGYTFDGWVCIDNSDCVFDKNGIIKNPEALDNIIENGITSITVKAIWVYNDNEADTDMLTFEIRGDGAYITGCDQSITGHLQIPSTYQGYPVVSIDSWSFVYCEGLTSVSFPDSVVDIPDGAFRFCSGLRSIHLSGNNPTFSILDGVLYNKEKTQLILYPPEKNITTFTIPKSVTEIASFAFNGSTKLISVTIPGNVTSIGESAFENCIKLREVYILNGVKTIDNYAFYYCGSLSSISIADSVTSIGLGAFSFTAYDNDDNNWEDGALYIGDHLIELENDIRGSYNIKTGTICIADHAFSECYNLISVHIPNSVDSIGNNAFENCTNLSSITIPNGVISIGDSTFENCTNLCTIVLSNSITSIGEFAFKETSYYNNVNNWDNDVLYIGTHLIEAKESLDGAYTIKPGTCCIANNAFERCTELISVNIPNSIKSIGKFAFSDCWNLVSINIPDGITIIKNWTFANCFYLRAIAIPKSVTTIEWCAFNNVDDVWYKGTESDKNKIKIDEGVLEYATWHYMFNDTPATHWAFDSIFYCYQKGVMSGVGNNNFNLNGTMTRGQVVTMLYSLEGKPAVSGSSGFSDVAANAWYAKAATWAAQNGVVSGMGDGRFAPDQPVTRAQFATMLYAYARHDGGNISARADLSDYPDYHSLTWERPYLEWAVAQGLISGNSINGVVKVDPKGQATRAQGAVIMRNFCEN